MIAFLLLFLVGISFSQYPAEYSLLKKFREKRDLSVGLFLLENYPDAVFEDELRVEVAQLLLEKGEPEKAKDILREVGLRNVRDDYGERVAKLWKELGLEPKRLLLRFPQYAVEFLGRVALSEEERKKVLEGLLREGKYEEVLRFSEECLYRGIALFRLRRYRESSQILGECEGSRAGIYALLSYLRLGDYKGAEEFLRKRKDPALYMRYAKHLLGKGELLKARRFLLLSGGGFEPLFYMGLIDFMRNRYMLAYEEFSEAHRYARGNIERAQASFWKFKTLYKLGAHDLALHYLEQASELAGFYSAVAKKFLGKRVYEPVLYTPPEGEATLGKRLFGIYRLGFLHYMRLEAFKRAQELTPEDILYILSFDPYTAIKLSARTYGANSDIYRAVAFPTPFSVVVKRASDKFRVDPALIYAVMRQESLFDPLALSRSRAKGLMQLLDRTARWKAKRIGYNYDDIFDIETNIFLGTAYLRFLLDFWKGDLVKAVASYNAGQGAVKLWRDYGDDFLFIETIPYGETRKYVKRVLWFYYIYKEKLSESSK